MSFYREGHRPIVLFFIPIHTFVVSISARNAKPTGKTKGKGKGGKRESIKEEEKEEELKHPVDAITVSSVTSEEMKLFR